MVDDIQNPITYKTCKYCGKKQECKYLKSTSTGKKIYTDLQGRWLHGAKCAECVSKRYEVKRACLQCRVEFSNKDRKISRYCSEKCREVAKALRLT